MSVTRINGIFFNLLSFCEINCIIVDDEPMAREILENYLQKTPSIHLVKSCKNVAEAIEITSKNNIDLILLDINMPEISGLTFAKIIDKKNKSNLYYSL